MRVTATTMFAQRALVSLFLTFDIWPTFFHFLGFCTEVDHETQGTRFDRALFSPFVDQLTRVEGTSVGTKLCKVLNVLRLPPRTRFTEVCLASFF